MKHFKCILYFETYNQFYIRCYLNKKDFNKKMSDIMRGVPGISRTQKIPAVLLEVAQMSWNCHAGTFQWRYHSGTVLIFSSSSVVRIPNGTLDSLSVVP